MDPLLLLAAGAALVLVLVLTPIVQFNRMTSLRNRCREAWADVETELRRRSDLIPNLVEAVKGYMAHERGVLQAVVDARAKAVAADGSADLQSQGQTALAGALSRLFAVAEGYPQLQASRNFLQLQEELANTEDRIQAARRFYNANVRDYRNQTRQFPGVLLARRFGMGDIAFFECDPLAMRAPTVAIPGA